MTTRLRTAVIVLATMMTVTGARSDAGLCSNGRRRAVVELRDGRRFRARSVCLVDACSHFGRPVAHPIDVDANVAEVRFVPVADGTVRRLELRYADGNVIERDVKVFEDEVDGIHFGGRRRSFYAAGTRNPYSASRFENAWGDHLRLGGRRWAPWRNVKRIRFADAGGPLATTTTTTVTMTSTTTLPHDSFAEQCGVNHWEHYGWDVGRNPYGGGHAGFSSETGRATLAAKLDVYAAHRVALLRVFALCDLRSAIVFASTGLPLYLDAHVIADVLALLDEAAQRGQRVVLVLFDYLIADGVAAERGVPVGEHPDVITDATKRTALHQVLRPLLRALRGHLALHSIDLMSEPEFASAVDPETLRAFLSDLTGVVHDELPGVPVTVGSRHRGDVDRYPFVDYAQYHYYDFMESEYPFDFSAAALGFPGGVLIGEAQPTSVCEKLTIAERNGNRGVIFWNDADYPFAPVLDDFERWMTDRCIAATTTATTSSSTSSTFAPTTTTRAGATTTTSLPPDVVTLVEPADGATHDPTVTFRWSIVHKRVGVRYCSKVITDKGSDPYDGYVEDVFPAGEAEELTVSLDPYYYSPSTFVWGVVTVACESADAPCADATPPCTGRALFSNVHTLHVP